jgi:NTP pyrophosphatase (non-canonical NTP hydrolase)
MRGTYNWLADELEELGEALKGQNKEAIEKEFADVICVACLTCQYNRSRP